MYWFLNLSTTRKILIACAVTFLLAGISAGGKAITGGVLCFVVFATAGLLLPNKRDKKSDKRWLYETTPHVAKKDRLLTFIFSLIALAFVFFSLYFLFSTLLQENYFAAILLLFVAIAGFSSFIYLHPRLYNEVYAKMKIVPLTKKTSINALFNEISKVVTPYGVPLLEKVPLLKKWAGIYRIIDYQWIVYFSIRQDQIVLQAEYIGAGESDFSQARHVFEFLNQLTELFCFYENTGKLPDNEQVYRIFHEKR